MAPDTAAPVPTEESEERRQYTTIYNVGVSEQGRFHLTTGEQAAQQIALLQVEKEQMRQEIERKDSTIFNLQFRTYLEGLAEAEKQASTASIRGGTTGALKEFFGKSLKEAITNTDHPLYAIQNRYRQPWETPGTISSQVEQKVYDLFSHFSRNIHKYFDGTTNDFRIPPNLDMQDALLYEILVALKPVLPRGRDGRVDTVQEHARFV